MSDIKQEFKEVLNALGQTEPMDWDIVVEQFTDHLLALHQRALVEELELVKNMDCPATYILDGKKNTGLAIPRFKIKERINQLKAKGQPYER